MSSLKSAVPWWIAVLILSTTFMRTNVVEAANPDDLVGEWTLSVDLSGVPQLAKLNVIETGPIPKAKLTSTFGEADVRSIAREGENYLVSYDVEFGEERLDVKLSLTLENDTLSGNVATGIGEMAMEWPVSGARVGTSAESDLRTVVETMASRMENEIAVTGPTLPVGNAEEYLGSWLLDISWVDKVGEGSSDAELLVVEDEGKVVAGLWARGKPLGIFYEISKSEKGFSWPIDLRFGETTIELTMEISLEDERLVGTWADEDEIVFVLSGVKRPAGEMSSISEDLLRQKPNVELVGVIADPARVVDVKDHEVYVQEGTDLTILNVTNPLLVRFKLCNLQERSHAVSVIDSTVYAVKRTSGLFQVFDISDPSAPRIAGSCRVPGNTPGAVAAEGSLVFAANWNGKADTQQLHIIDISEPSTPTLLTSYDTPRGSTTYDIAVSGSDVLVAAAGGLRIIDVSKPRTPALLSTFRGRARWVRGVDFSGSMAYIATSMATGASWLQIVDISDPSAPTQVGICRTPGVAQDVAVLGTLAFVADREAGLEVIDVSDPTNPIAVGFFRTRMFASRVAVSEQLTFMSLKKNRHGQFQGLTILKYDSRLVHTTVALPKTDRPDLPKSQRRDVVQQTRQQSQRRDIEQLPMQQSQRRDVAQLPKHLATLSGHVATVTSAAFSPDGKLLATGGAGRGSGHLKLWDLSTGKPVWQKNVHTSHVRGVAYSPDGRMVATASYDGTIGLWDAAGGEQLDTLTGHENWVNAVAFSPDGRYLISAGRDTNACLWQIHPQGSQRAQLVTTLRGHEMWVMAVAFSADGTKWASASADPANGAKPGRIIVSNTPGQMKHESQLELTTGGFALAFSSDSKTIAVGGNGEITIYDANTNKVVRTWKAHNGKVNAVAFSHDDKVLASGSSDKSVKLWDVKTGKLVNTIDAHRSQVYAVTFSPDGKRLVTTSRDKTARLWNVK